MTKVYDLDTEERCRRLKEAIVLWVGHQPLDQTMSREELAGLDGIERHLTLSKSLVPNIIRICRREKRADTRMAVLILITLLCDNNEGRCRLSIKRMAELLRRKEDNVRGAIKSLEEGGEISVDRTTGGMLNSYWPNAPRAVAAMRPAVSWFVDALSDRPVRSRPVLVAKNDDPPRSRGVGETPPVTVGYPPAGDPQYISRSSSKDSKPNQTRGGYPFQGSAGATGCSPTTAGRPHAAGLSSSTTPPQVAPLDDAPTPTVHQADPSRLQEDNTERYNITFEVDQSTDHLHIVQRAGQYVHETGDGRKVPVSKMGEGHLRNQLPIALESFRKLDGFQRGKNDTSLSLLAYKLRAQALRMKLPKGMPTDAQLFEAVAEDDAVKRETPINGREERAAVKAAKERKARTSFAERDRAAMFKP